MPDFDVIGVGLNATDTVLLLPEFPAYAGKVRFDSEVLTPGGQVATAMITCARLGLRAKYIGTVGDDERGRVQMESLRESGLNIEEVRVRPGAETQSGFILIDRRTGERTVLWRRPEELRLDPEEIDPAQIVRARLLHVDGHDIAAVSRAARIAREAGIPVTADLDTMHAELGTLLQQIDFLVASSNLPSEWTGEPDPFRALKQMQREYGMRVAAMTLGADGALALCEDTYFYSPGYLVECVDTTGAGDVFHGAFCYAVLQRMPMPETLDFCNALAALNCRELGARGGIRDAAEARSLMARAGRRSNHEFAAGARRAS